MCISFKQILNDNKIHCYINLICYLHIFSFFYITNPTSSLYSPMFEDTQYFTYHTKLIDTI